MMRKRTALAVVVMFLVCFAAVRRVSAFSLLDPHTWPGLTDPYKWPFTLVPVPEVATDPNGGVTYGVLPVFLFKNSSNQITDIIAPDINNNTALGLGGTFRYLAYPSADTQWYVVAGAQQRISRQVDILYSTGRTRTHRWSFDGRFFFNRDPTGRFFGIGNDSERHNETNFTLEEVMFKARLGLNLTPSLQIALMERPRYVRILRGGFKSLPQTSALFPHVKGINGGSEVLNQLSISYDTRDSVDIPHDGGLAMLYAGFADRRFMSSDSYTQFGGELRRYVPIGRRIVLAGHLFLEYEPAGNEVPFWSMSQLGGYDSMLINGQTLRGFGAGRFVDNDLAVANIEMRTRAFNTRLFETNCGFEVAPFVDAGRVFHNPSTDPFTSLHPVGGVGLRAIVKPFVVGYLDIGYGGEGAAIFTGLNYPF